MCVGPVQTIWFFKPNKLDPSQPEETIKKISTNDSNNPESNAVNKSLIY